MFYPALMVQLWESAQLLRAKYHGDAVVCCLLQTKKLTETNANKPTKAPRVGTSITKTL